MPVTAAELIGAWRLIRYDFHAPDGRVLPRYPSGARGLLHYGADGRMSAHLAAAERPATGDDMSAVAPETARATLRGYMAYAGRWSLEGEEVRHDVEMCLRPDWEGTTVRRTAALSPEGVLTLRALASRMDGLAGMAELDWTKVA